MSIFGIFSNYGLIAALIAWGIAQVIKVPLYYWRNRRWKWALLFYPGGMPSSHTALVTAAAHSIGLFTGFNQPLYGLAVVVAIVVVYDATGIRRQAGLQATMLNAMISDLAKGHPLKQTQLREVLGHTPLEALAGLVLGLLVAQVVWMVYG